MVTAIMSETKSVNAIAQQRVEALAHAEPKWLRDARLHSFDSYQQTPMPSSKDEDWRRTDISQLDPDSLATLDIQPLGKGKQDLPSLLASLKEFSNEFSGIITQSVLHESTLELSSELEKQGVILCSLNTAIEKHPELIRPYLTAELEGSTNQKFVLMNHSLFNCGVFLHVPANLEIKLPFVSSIDFASQSGAAFPRLIISLGANSKAQFISVFSSVESGSSEPALISAASEIHLSAGANLSYLELNNLNSRTTCVNQITNHVRRDASLKAATVVSGGQLTKSEIVTCLEEPGANSTILGVVLGNDSEHYNFNTIQEHQAPDTNSDINFRVALNDSSSSLYQGIIRVDKVAQRIQAFQSNKNLLLGQQSRADSIPKLEILADDVKCSHGATVGPVDAEQVFYLNSRGLSCDEAKELIVLGFFRQVLERLDIEGAAEWLSSVLSPKLSHRQS